MLLGPLSVSFFVLFQDTACVDMLCNHSFKNFLFISKNFVYNNFLSDLSHPIIKIDVAVNSMTVEELMMNEKKPIGR